jgi:hypothetical protein
MRDGSIEQAGATTSSEERSQTLHVAIGGKKMGGRGRIYGQISQGRPLRKLVFASFSCGNRQVGPSGDVGAISTEGEEVERQAGFGVHCAHDVSSARVPDGE